MATADLLLNQHHIEAALGDKVLVQRSSKPSAVSAVGSLLASTALDSAFRSFAGALRAEDGTELPVAVGSLVLAFGGEPVATTTFDHVAQAAHLRTRIGECLVAVETSTGANGLVSYWGYILFKGSLVVLTLDTLDPVALPMSDFRALVTAAADLLELETL